MIVNVGYADGDVRELSLLPVTEQFASGYPAYIERDLSIEDVLKLNENIKINISRIISLTKYTPVHVILKGVPVFVSTLFKRSDRQDEKALPSVPIMWRTGVALHVNLWHFIHEITELELKISGINEPRWIVEGLAQYTAYSYFIVHHADWIPYVWEHYKVEDAMITNDLFEWGILAYQSEKQQREVSFRMC